MKHTFLLFLGFSFFAGCATVESPSRKLASTSDFQDPCALRSFCQNEPETMHWSVLDPSCEYNRFFKYETKATKNSYKRSAGYEVYAIPAVTEVTQFDYSASTYVNSVTGEKYYGKDYTQKVFCGDALYLGFTFEAQSKRLMSNIPVVDTRTYLFNNIRNEPELSIQDRPVTKTPTEDDDGRFDSQSRNLTMMFFPRKQAFSIRPAGSDELEVTLPTGESVFFDSSNHTLKAGVLKEKPLSEVVYRTSDTKKIELTYSGTGIALKATRRAGSPKMKTTVEISNPSKAQSCQVPSTDLWKPFYGEEDELHFLFDTDEAFYSYLKAKCPQVAP